MIGAIDGLRQKHSQAMRNWQYRWVREEASGCYLTRLHSCQGLALHLCLASVAGPLCKTARVLLCHRWWWRKRANALDVTLPPTHALSLPLPPSLAPSASLSSSLPTYLPT